MALITPDRMNFLRNNILLDYLLTAIGKEVVG